MSHFNLEFYIYGAYIKTPSFFIHLPIQPNMNSIDDRSVNIPKQNASLCTVLCNNDELFIILI